MDQWSSTFQLTNYQLSPIGEVSLNYLLVYINFSLLYRGFYNISIYSSYSDESRLCQLLSIYLSIHQQNIYLSISLHPICSCDERLVQAGRAPVPCPQLQDGRARALRVLQVRQVNLNVACLHRRTDGGGDGPSPPPWNILLRIHKKRVYFSQ